MRREGEEKTRGGWNQKETYVDAGNQSFLERGGRRPHERGQVKSSRRESEAPGEEGEEVKSPKRKVIRVESEETEDNVRETNDTNQEEAEKYDPNRA